VKSTFHCFCVSLSHKAQHILFPGEEVQSAFSKEWREAQRQRMNAMPREGSDTPVKLDPITRRMPPLFAPVGAFASLASASLCEISLRLLMFFSRREAISVTRTL
jgi:hypothetical protein